MVFCPARRGSAERMPSNASDSQRWCRALAFRRPLRATGRFANRAEPMSDVLLMERMAVGAGWRDPSCDTMPNSAVNIWHFPEARRPETREVLSTRSAAFVTAGDVLAARR